MFRSLLMSQLSFAAVILAAGSGTRMKSAMPKVMHPIAGRPMIAYPLEALRPLSPAATLVVIGPQTEHVPNVFSENRPGSPGTAAIEEKHQARGRTGP